MSDGYTATNKITKDFSPNLSLAITEGKDFFAKETTKYDRIYYILEGVLHLIIDNESVVLNPGDSIYIPRVTIYEMSGTFRSIVVNHPAFGTLE